VLGAAAHAVLPGMRARAGRDVAVHHGRVVGPSHRDDGYADIAAAGLRNYALALRQAVAGHGIFVGHVALDLFIEPGAGEPTPTRWPTATSTSTSTASSPS